MLGQPEKFFLYTNIKNVHLASATSPCLQWTQGDGREGLAVLNESLERGDSVKVEVLRE